LVEPHVIELRTPRTVLRNWNDDDLEPFARLNADPEVMRWFPSTLTTDQSNGLVTRIRGQLADRGWGLWALEVPGVSRFCGFVGLSVVMFESSFSSPTSTAVEIGWRLDSPWWGFGYASESAAACLHFAFETLELPEVVSFTTVKNIRSRAVMERLGMTHDPDGDFEHPNIPQGDPIRPHVLYRLSSPDWRSHAALR